MTSALTPPFFKMSSRSNLRYGLNAGRPTTSIPKVVKPSQRKGVQSKGTLVVRSVIREVSPVSHERPVSRAGASKRGTSTDVISCFLFVSFSPSRSSGPVLLLVSLALVAPFSPPWRCRTPVCRWLSSISPSFGSAFARALPPGRRLLSLREEGHGAPQELQGQEGQEAHQEACT